MATRAFWDEIMVPTEDIDLSTPPPSNRSARYLMEKLNKPIDRICFFEVLYKEPRLGLKSAMSHQEIIKNIFENQNSFFMDLVAIITFKRKKRHDIIKEISEKNLSNTQLGICRARGPRSKTSHYSYYALLLSLFLKSNEYLKDAFNMDLSARRGFKSYKIHSNNDIDAISINYDIRGATLSDIDDFLDDFEKQRNTGKISHCWHIIKKSTLTEIFIRRYTVKDYVMQVRENLLTDFSEYIIMKFSGVGKSLELHSTHISPAEDMANYFARQIFDKSCEYQLDEGKVSWKRARSFINSVATATDKKFILCYIKVRNTNLPTLPRLVVESKDDGSIVNDIARLKTKGINLLKLVKNIERMKFMFEGTKIPIFIKRYQDKVEFMYQYNLLDNETRKKFENYMETNYGINVIPYK